MPPVGSICVIASTVKTIMIVIEPTWMLRPSFARSTRNSVCGSLTLQCLTRVLECSKYLYVQLLLLQNSHCYHSVKSLIISQFKKSPEMDEQYLREMKEAAMQNRISSKNMGN